MTVYVLVHGAWGGGWYWRDVADALRRSGNEVFTPTLTGLGERSHLGSSEIDLDTHVKDILHVLYYENLRHVVLVGHSYGGMVITGVAAQTSDRLAHLVYLDGDMPADGQSRFDIQPEARDWWEALAREGDGWRVNLDLPEQALLEVIPDASRRAWYLERSQGQGHPIGTLSQAVQGTVDAAVPKTFIGCSQDVFGMRSGLYGRMARQAQNDPDVTYVELEANHFAPISDPEKVANALLAIAVDEVTGD